MAEAENLFAEAMGDERVKKFNDRARLAKFGVDKTLHKEIQQFVIFGSQSRKKFEPNSAEDLKGLIDSMERTQAYRDRLTGILITTSITIDELDVLLKSGEAYLFTEYADLMKKCSNKETREAAVRYVYGPIFRASAQWKSLKSIAETAKINLNDTYFALREIGENGRTILDARKVRRSFDAA
jgi:hypothetical protein